MKLAQVRKLFVALIGAGTIIAAEFLGDQAFGLNDDLVSIFDSVVALLTAFGVFQVPNAPSVPLAPPGSLERKF